MKNAPYLGNRQEYISLLMVAGKSEQYFKQIPNLERATEDIQIKCIETYSVDFVPKDPQLYPLASAACLKGSFLVLKIKNEEVFTAYPLASLAPEFNSDLYRELDLVNVDWNQSYVQIPDPTLLTAGGVYFFNISYNKGPIGSFN